MPRRPEGYVSGRTCPRCGGRKDFSASRCQRCYGDDRLAEDKGSHASLTKRAQKLYPFDESSRCEHCGTAEGLSRHHRNGERRDNRPENVAILCLSCHTKEEWRIKRSDPDCPLSATEFKSNWERSLAGTSSTSSGRWPHE